MVRKNKLLIGCLVLLLVLSVGYALFSETITINGTATAKGSFDITTTCTPGMSDDMRNALKSAGLSGLDSTDYGQFGFANSICDVNGNMVTMTTDLLYPTANRVFTVKMTNTGSIPALIWGSTRGDLVESLSGVDNDFNWVLKNKETNDMIKSGTGHKINGRFRFTDNKFGGFVVSKEGTLLSDENVIYDNERGYAGIKLNTGESFFTIINFIYPDGAESIMADNGISEYFEFKINHEFKWEQYTDSPNYEPTTFSEWCFTGC